MIFVYSISCFLVAVSGLCACISALPFQNGTTSTGAILHNALGRDEPRQGWTSSPNQRGTTDILWGCGFTVVLCCWSMLCLNVPAPKDTYCTNLRRRIWIFFLTLAGPEVVTVTAVAQYLSAHHSVREFAAAGISDWSMQHAFYADMGGFILQTKDWVPFPISAKQLLWLIQRGYVSVPRMMLGHIKDKDKVDAIARLLMVLQTVWFLAQFFARVAQGLAITVIELSTVAFIYASLPMVLLWRHKPADVGIAEVLVTDASMAEILLAGGDAAREPYSNTPLDFIDRKEWAWTIYWSHLRYLLRYLHITAGSHVRPVDHVSNFNTPEVPSWIFFGGSIYYFGFAAIFVSGWNLRLPTETELLLWRVASLVYIGSLLVGVVTTDIVFKVWPNIRARLPPKPKEGPDNPIQARSGHLSPDDSSSNGSRLSKASRPRPRTIWDWLRNNSVGQDPQVSIPLGGILAIYVLVVAYFIARAYIIVEDIVELRSLPQSSYETPNWQQFVPHIG